MLHWLVALFSMPQGYVSEMTARLPSALAYIAMCYGFFVFFSRRYHVGKVLIATLVLITSFEVHRAAMTCRVDMVLTAFMVGGFLFLYRWKERGYRGMPWLASLMISGAILTKGPIGAILPCAVMAVMMIVDGEKTKPVLKALLKVALLSSVLPLCWYVAAYHVGGDRFLDLMMEENFGRFLGKMSYESHENGPFYYFPILLSGLLPWSLLIVGSLFAVRWREVGMPKAQGCMVAFPLDGQRDAVCRCRIGSDIRVLRNTEKQTQCVPVADVSVPESCNSQSHSVAAAGTPSHIQGLCRDDCCGWSGVQRGADSFARG